MYQKILLAVVIIVAAYAALSFYRAHQQDQCLDAGGVWDVQQHVCNP